MPRPPSRPVASIVSSVDLLYRSLHLLAAAVWGGGLVMLGLLAASSRQVLSETDRGALFRLVGQRFLILSAVSALVLGATGAELTVDRFGSLTSLGELPGGDLVIAKTAIFAVLVVFVVVHSFVLAPRLRELKRQHRWGAADPAIERGMRRAALLGGVVNASLLLGTVVIFVLAADLVT